MKTLAAKLSIVSVSMVVISLVLTGQSVAKLDLKNAVAIWLFDEDKGDVVQDYSEKGNDGKIIGAKWVKGKFGQALEFDGADDYVDCGSDKSLNPTTAITVVAWVKSTSQPYSAYWSVVSKYNAYILGPPDPKTQMCFIIHDGAWQYGSCYTPKDVTAWHHFAGTYDQKAKEKNLYVNGVLEDTTSPSGTISPDTGPLHLGHREGVALGQDHYKGLIDEVAIFDVVLSKDEINDIMKTGFNRIFAVSPSGKLATVWSDIKTQ